MRERKAQPKFGRERGAEVAGSEKPDFGRTDIRRHGLHLAERMLLREIVGEKAEELVELLRKFVREHGLTRTAQRERRDSIGPRCAAKPEVNSAGMQRLQHAKRLSNMKRGMIRQHHTARPDADAL